MQTIYISLSLFEMLTFRHNSLANFCTKINEEVEYLLNILKKVY